MSYSISAIRTMQPAGCISAYFGTSDPAGWVICDGTTRTNNSDGRYNTVAGLSIGSGGSGTTNYTPPDLRGSFLRGIGTNGSYTYAVGPSVKSAQDMAILNHGHSMDSHSHETINGNVTNYYALRITSGNHSVNSVNQGSNEINIVDNYYDLANNSTSATTESMGNTSVQGPSNAYISNTETRPFNCGVNWILKL